MNLPADFIIRTKPLLGKDWENFLNALQDNIPTSIRLNRQKTKKLSSLLKSNIPWCEAGYYLDVRPQFTFDPLFHAGCYYVQEASSMFVEQGMKQYVEGDVKVLDLCAAPGGKSTLIADLLSNNSLLVSNEVIRSRANILSENIAKCGFPNIVVTNNDPAAIGCLNGFFDVILVDAPCSGEGMFRKDEGAIAEWSIANVKLCKERQQRILVDVWTALKSGGILFYSTCTYNTEENEENVRWIRDELGAEVLPLTIDEEWGISPSVFGDMPVYRFFPHKTKGEGFFFAVLRKMDDNLNAANNRKSTKTKDKSNKFDLSEEYKRSILRKEDFTFYSKGDLWYAFPTSLHADAQILKMHLNVISEGVCIGEYKGKDFIPSQSLALSLALNRDAFSICDVDWATAVSYLRKEALVLENQLKGYLLLTYRDVPLGFVKNIGNRANNLYPQEWRIRSSNIPDEIVAVV